MSARRCAEREEAGRAEDLAFLEELREASLARLGELALNLSFGGPEWQRVAIRRALDRRDASGF